jgi:hypothetical protein
VFAEPCAVGRNKRSVLRRSVSTTLAEIALFGDVAGPILWKSFRPRVAVKRLMRSVRRYGFSLPGAAQCAALIAPYDPAPPKFLLALASVAWIERQRNPGRPFPLATPSPGFAERSTRATVRNATRCALLPWFEVPQIRWLLVLFSGHQEAVDADDVHLLADGEQLRSFHTGTLPPLRMRN